MSDYTVLQNTVYTLCVWATGIPFVWENEPRGHIVGTYGILNGPDNSDALGRDRVKYTLDGGGTNRASVIALRTGDIHIRVISQAHVPANQKGGWALERLRMAMVLQEVTDAVNASDVAIVGFSPIRVQDAVAAKRVESVAAVDMRICWMPSAYASATDYGRISSVSGELLLDSAAPVIIAVP